jgi:hypothetical protein
MVLLLVSCAVPRLPGGTQLGSRSEPIEARSSPTDVGRADNGAGAEFYLNDRAGSPEAERVVGYAAMAAGVVALSVLAIGFYKLARMLGH